MGIKLTKGLYGERMRTRKQKYFVCDFETTVYEGQKHTEVWAAACVEMFTDDVKLFHSIDEQFEFFIEQKCNLTAYYHNLKFDGSFWLSYLLVDMGFKQAFIENENGEVIGFKKDKDMRHKEVKYLIAEMGQWYSISFMWGGKLITLLDSLKLLPFSVSKIGKSFGTKHKKLDMEYKGFRYAGCEITDEEANYIKNDVLVVKEAMEIMFEEGHKKMTIGSCCLAEYKNIIGSYKYKTYFPYLYDIKTTPNYGAENAGDYIRKAYRGGWCYIARGKEGRIFEKGCTADVNSLYPSMMSSESGNIYPIGEPTFWSGDYLPPQALQAGKYFFVRIKTKFYLKDGKLPFIQIKSSYMYKGNEMLETSDIFNRKDGKWYNKYIDVDGNEKDARVELTLTMTDYKLMLEHYDLVDFEIIDGCYFDGSIGIFDDYIEKYKQQKLTSKGARRELAKLFLNNLYGKMAASTDSSYKIAFVKEDKSIGFYPHVAKDKKGGYIAVGAAITSYARNFTIRTAQQNYHGVNKRGFIYADTDSIHCDLEPEELRGVTLHDKNFCCWKLESKWDLGLFVRQKTYAEHIIIEDGEEVEPYYNLKCAGMPDRCKNLFLRNIAGDRGENDEVLTQEQLEFLAVPRSIHDFTIGLCIPGKLLPKRIRGGTLLIDTTYEMR